MTKVLPYDPGVLPSLPAPSAGESVLIEVSGRPPVKDRRQSIRNRNHPLHSSFVSLRRAAIAAMAGRAWVFGPVEVRIKLFEPEEAEPEPWSMFDYVSGILDTLDGSTGNTFTYLPIVFEDDCQVRSAQAEWVDAPEIKYSVEIFFR